MTMFKCDGCGCADVLEYAHKDAKPLEEGQWLCSSCRPRIVDGKEINGTWHNHFPKTVYDPLQHDVVNDNPFGVNPDQ